ncbi:hypothetical protein VTI74DRAFT_9600 [Chaetomium olivicolor]
MNRCLRLYPPRPVETKNPTDHVPAELSVFAFSPLRDTFHTGGIVRVKDKFRVDVPEMRRVFRPISHRRSLVRLFALCLLLFDPSKTLLAVGTAPGSAELELEHDIRRDSDRLRQGLLDGLLVLDATVDVVVVLALDARELEARDLEREHLLRQIFDPALVTLDRGERDQALG